VPASRLRPTGVCVFCVSNYAGRGGSFSFTPKETRNEPFPLAQSSTFGPIPYADPGYQNDKLFSRQPMIYLARMMDNKDRCYAGCMDDSYPFKGAMPPCPKSYATGCLTDTCRKI